MSAEQSLLAHGWGKSFSSGWDPQEPSGLPDLRHRGILLSPQGLCCLLGHERHPDKQTEPSPSAPRLCTDKGTALVTNHRDFHSSFPGHDTEAQGTWELQPLGSPSPLHPLTHQACRSSLSAACTGWIAVERCLSKPFLLTASRSKVPRASKKLLLFRDASSQSS